MRIDLETVENCIILKAQEGNAEAMDYLVERHRPLIHSLSMRIHCYYMEKEELIQAGMLGFLQAVKRYREDYDTKLTTYAVPWILGEMKKAMRRLRLSIETLSLDKELDCDGYNLQSVIQGNSDIGESCIDLHMALEKLDQEEQILICLRYFREKTQKDTSILLGKSQAQISRKEKAALDKLRMLLT